MPEYKTEGEAIEDWMSIAPEHRTRERLEQMKREIVPKPDSKKAMRPESYQQLPKGVRCKCFKLWREADGSYWCCKEPPCATCLGAGYFTHLGVPAIECIKCNGTGLRA